MRKVVVGALFVSCAMAAVSAGGPAAGLIHIGSSKQLFVDDYLIESVTGAARVMNPAAKVPHNPVVRPDRPWEGKEVRLSYVIFDDKDQRFKMWYSTTTFVARREGAKVVVSGGGEGGASESRICLATSKDGTHWEKPDLGLVEFQGSKANNIVPAEKFMPIFIDDRHEKNPARRFKGLVQVTHKDRPGMQYNLFFSSDAFNWVPYEANPVIDTSPRPGRWGPAVFMGWDPIRRTYAVHMENCLHKYCPLETRVIGRAESPDMVRWTEPETIIVPDAKDPPDTEFYYMPVTAYEGMYVGLLANFRTTRSTILPEVVFSRDGIHYNRDFRQPIIEPGSPSEFDSTVIYPDPPLVHGDRIFLYYTGANWRSDESLLARGDTPIAAIGLATVPLDGFVSLDGSGHDFSEIVTRSFTFSGDRLHLNVECGGGEAFRVVETAAGRTTGAGDRTGSKKTLRADPCDVRVEILGADHIPQAGYGPGEANAIGTTGGRQVVSWKARSNVSELAGKPVKLRFRFKNAKLFSFQFE
jgi:hypothetical protein